MTRVPRPNAVCPATLVDAAAYLDGELDVGGCAAIERHCEGCGPCARFVNGLRETTGLCRDAGARPLPDDVKERARARIDQLLQKPHITLTPEYTGK